MKHSTDTSVLVAAFASWHEHHGIAAAALARTDAVVVHCLLETYSVLTRLPAPHRMSSPTVAGYLRLAFGKSALLSLPASEQRSLVARCASLGISGGAVYDALIGATCARAGARLLTLDARARATYSLLGVEHELLA